MTVRMRFGRLFRPGRRWFGGSGEAGDGEDQKDSADDAVEGPEMPQQRQSGGNEERDEVADGFVEGSRLHDFEKSASVGFDLDDVRWEVLHGSVSLKVSAFAGIILLGAGLVEPDAMRPWQVIGSFGVYVAGLQLFFAMERRDYRKRSVQLPPDRFGGGRMGLCLMAVVFCSAGGEETAGLAGWIAFAALVLGSMSDGAWIALAAERRGLGFWRAWRELLDGEKEARRQYWTALFGEGRR